MSTKIAEGVQATDQREQSTSSQLIVADEHTVQDLVQQPYPIINVGAHEGVAMEQMGTKAKFWIEDAGVRKLVKFGRPNTGENWAEKIACELATLLGLPHAHYDLAEASGLPCVVSTSIIPSSHELVHGNQVIAGGGGRSQRVRLYRTREHTVSRVIAAIVVQTRPGFRQAIEMFAGYLMFDAWIGNTDRHEENWGLLLGPDGVQSLAPTFDHASSLGRELDDSEKLDRLRTRDTRYTPAAFAGRARSALFANSSDAKPLRPIEAFREVGKVVPSGALAWLARLREIDSALVRALFSRMPEESISAPSIEFATAMLEANRAALLSLGSLSR